MLCRGALEHDETEGALRIAFIPSENIDEDEY